LAGDADNEYAMIDSSIVRAISTARRRAQKTAREEAIAAAKAD